MEVLVAVLLMLIALIVRSSLSADKPGALKHTFESIYGFLLKSAQDAGVEHPEKYMSYFATILSSSPR